MSVNNFVWDELKFFISRLSALRVSETLRLNDEAFCVSTGTYSENWIYCPKPERVNDAVNFFRERDVSFMWPVTDSESLKHTDLIYAGDLTAMYLEPNRKLKNEFQSLHSSSTTIMRIDSHSEAELWTNAMWRSFGGQGDVPDNYYAFAEAMSEDENLSLYLAYHEGEAAGTIMTTSMGGVYYVGVLPEMRRKGIAREMMNEICRQHSRITLQSTPSGYPFYRSYGFTELFRMPLYSTESDVF